MGKELKYSIDELIKRSKSKFKKHFDYSLIDKINYNGVISKVKFRCIKHNNIFETTFSRHLEGNGGCRKCMYEGNTKKQISNTEDFIQKAKIIHGEKYDYSKVKYIRSNQNVEILCPIHNLFLQQPNAHLSGKQGCPYCKESKGEREIARWLSFYKIKFIRQHKFEGCKKKKYFYFDFYLPEYNICIEFDGKQHFYSTSRFGGDEELIKIKRRDNFKTRFCKKESINLIRIRYNNISKIEQIIKKLK